MIRSAIHAFSNLEVNIEHNDADLDEEGKGPTGVMLHCIQCKRYCELSGLKAKEPNGKARKRLVWQFCLNALRHHFGLASLVTIIDGPTSDWEKENTELFALG